MLVRATRRRQDGRRAGGKVQDKRQAALPLVAFTAGCRRLRVWLLG